MIHDFIKETSHTENITEDVDLLLCYQSVLNLVNYTITCADDDIIGVYKHDNLYKTILVFQTFYSSNIKYKVNILMIYLCKSY